MGSKRLKLIRLVLRLSKYRVLGASSRYMAQKTSARSSSLPASSHELHRRDHQLCPSWRLEARLSTSIVRDSWQNAAIAPETALSEVPLVGRDG